MPSKFVRWMSGMGTQANEVPVITGTQGDLTISRDVFEEVKSGLVTLTCDPTDDVAVAVISAVQYNVDQEIAAEAPEVID